MDKAQSSLLSIFMMAEGIVPIQSGRENVKKSLDQMSPEEARKAKRKFRKLWRKLCKKEGYLGGRGRAKPSSNDLCRRKNLVIKRILLDKVAPTVENLHKK